MKYRALTHVFKQREGELVSGCNIFAASLLRTLLS
jgi:hypothetical protein